MPFYTHGARSFSGVALYQDPDRVAEGYALLEEAWPRFKETAARANQVFVCVERAEGLRQMGQIEVALVSIRRGLRLSERYNERNFDAELHRLHGALLIESGDNTEEPIQSIERAIEIATKQGAKLFLLRAVTEAATLAERGQADPSCVKRLANLLESYPDSDTSKEVEYARSVLQSSESG